MVDVVRNPLGDVEFVVVHLDDDHLSPVVLEALLRQVEAGSVRPLDFLVIRRLAHDRFALTEVDGDEFALAGLELAAPGLISEDDVRHFASGLPEGSLAALILVEQTWGERFSRDVRLRGDRVVATQPIPARVVNAVLADAEHS